MTKLKPCPKCGCSSVHVWKDYLDEVQINWTAMANDDCWYVGCITGKCSFEGPFDTERQAIEAWNKRVNEHE